MAPTSQLVLPVRGLMSKKSSKQKRSAGRGRRRKLAKGVIAALALALVATAAAVTRLPGLGRLSPLTAAPAPQSQPNLQLSKEYVYAGGRLVATEEPGNTPTAPTDLKHVRWGKKFKGTLTWADRSNNESGFKVEQRTWQYVPGLPDPIVYGQWGEVATVGPNLTDINLELSCEADYRVKAFNGSGVSAPSNWVAGCYYYALEEGAPTGLVAIAQLSTQVSLTWTPPSGSVSRYEVERLQSTSGEFQRLLPDPASPSFVDAGAAPGTAYLYRVRAVRPDETFSGYSNEDLATTVIFTPVQAGVTLIQARNLNERRQAVGAVRALTGLAPPTWTHPDPVSSPAASRRKVYFEDVQELRTRLDEALLRLGRFQPYPADPPLARGAPVRAALFTQISGRVE